MSNYRVLTVKQPYAGLLVMGIKKIETRSWATKYRGKLLIHSAKTPDKDALNKCLTDRTVGMNATNRPFAYGYIIGEVELVDCFKQSDILVKFDAPRSYDLRYGYWNMETHFAWMCKNPVWYVNPIPVKGKLGIWNWEGEL